LSALRVLVVATVLGRGPSGVHRHAVEILPRAARILGAQGGELVLLEGREPIRAPELDGIARLASGAPFGPAWRRAAPERRAILHALAHAKDRPFDVVHQGHLPFATALIRRTGAAPVWLVHDTRKLEASGHGLASKLAAAVGRHVARRAARDALGIVCVSAATATDLARRVACVRGRTALVPNAADHLAVRARTPALPAFNLGVGHLEPRKGWRTAIAALARDPELPPLWIAGAAHGRRGAQELAALEVMARALGVADRLRILGAVGDHELEQLLATAAAVVLPSQLEGFSIPALEALHAGTPLALSDIPAHREVAGELAHYFPPGDAEQCAAAQRAARSQPRERTELAANSAHRFRWDHSAQALVNAWRSAAHARS